MSRDKRAATPLAALNVRQLDKTTDPVKPFEHPYITLTFDDGWESIYTEAAPMLQKYGIRTTQYVLSSDKIERDRGYMTFGQIGALHKAGHEIDCHSVDHPDLVTLNSSSLFGQLKDCKSQLEKRFGVTVDDFASPYGSINSTTTAAIKQVYRSSRNTAGDITTNGADYNDVNVRDRFDRYNIIAVTIRRETTPAQLQTAIDYAVKNNGWLVLNYHQVENGDTKYGIDMAGFEDQLKMIHNAPARIVTLGQFMDAQDKAEGRQ